LWKELSKFQLAYIGGAGVHTQPTPEQVMNGKNPIHGMSDYSSRSVVLFLLKNLQWLPTKKGKLFW
jgi:hypothetical protein